MTSRPQHSSPLGGSLEHGTAATAGAANGSGQTHLLDHRDLADVGDLEELEPVAELVDVLRGELLRTTGFVNGLAHKVTLASSSLGSAARGRARLCSSWRAPHRQRPRGAHRPSTRCGQSRDLCASRGALVEASRDDGLDLSITALASSLSAARPGSRGRRSIRHRPRHLGLDLLSGPLDRRTNRWSAWTRARCGGAYAVVTRRAAAGDDHRCAPGGEIQLKLAADAELICERSADRSTPMSESCLNASAIATIERCGSIAPPGPGVVKALEPIEVHRRRDLVNRAVIVPGPAAGLRGLSHDQVALRETTAVTVGSRLRPGHTRRRRFQVSPALTSPSSDAAQVVVPRPIRPSTPLLPQRRSEATLRASLLRKSRGVEPSGACLNSRKNCLTFIDRYR